MRFVPTRAFSKVAVYVARFGHPRNPTVRSRRHVVAILRTGAAHIRWSPSPHQLLARSAGDHDALAGARTSEVPAGSDGGCSGRGVGLGFRELWFDDLQA